MTAMRLLAVLFVLLLSFETTGAARAQSEPDPAAVREAQTLMNRFGIDALAKQQMAAASQQLRSMVQSIDADKEKEELMAEYARLAEKEIETRLPKYFEEVTLIYVRNFTLDELKELNAFYDSRLGQKLVEKTPELFKESLDLSQRLGVDVVQEVWRLMLPELRKRGIKTAPN